MASFLDAVTLAAYPPTADFDNYGNVDASNAALLSQNWDRSFPEISPPSVDTNGDRRVYDADAANVFTLWTGDQIPDSVPEPQTFLGITLILAVAMRPLQQQAGNSPTIDSIVRRRDLRNDPLAGTTASVRNARHTSRRNTRRNT